MRRTHPTPEQAWPDVIAAIEHGCTAVAAIASARLSNRAFYEYVNADETGERAAELEAARARAEKDMSDVVWSIARESEEDHTRLKAAETWLKRRAPKDWSAVKVTRLEIQAGVQQVLDAVRGHMSAEAYMELVRAIATVTGLGDESADGDSATH